MTRIFNRLTFILFLTSLVLNNVQSATIIISSLPQANKNPFPKIAKNDTESYRVQIVKDFLNCAQILNNQCIKCQNNYFLNTNKKCSYVTDLCLLFNLDQGICIKCYDKGIIIDGVCYSSGQKPNIKNHCMIWSQKQCLKCQKAFYLQAGSCKPVDIDFQCRKWDLNGKCFLCNQGYFLSQQKCVKSSNLIKCPSDQYFSKENLCSYPPQNCLTWDPFNGKCVKCQKNHQFSEWKCMRSQNLKNQAKQEEVEPIIIENCLKTNKDKSTCLECNQEYILDIQKGICKQQIIKCRNYKNSSQCISCIQNSNIDESLCQLKPNLIKFPQIYGCQIWKLTQTKCLKCQQNFLLNSQGYCVLNEDHCQKETFQNKICPTCRQGYKNLGGLCQIISQLQIQTRIGCKLYDWVNNSCIICEDQFIRLDSGICQKPIQNCIQQKQNNCLKCLPNNDLRNGKCIPFSISKCVDFENTGKCKKCQNSFALIQGQCRTFKQLGTILLDYIQFSPQKLKQKIVIFTAKLII